VKLLEQIIDHYQPEFEEKNVVSLELIEMNKIFIFVFTFLGLMTLLALYMQQYEVE
jgi:hypothetical protein